MGRNASCRASDAAYLRKLEGELTSMERHRRRIAESQVQRPLPLMSYPAAFELVQAMVSTWAAGHCSPMSDWATYRGLDVLVTASLADPMFVITLDGRQIGVSAYDALLAAE